MPPPAAAAWPATELAARRIKSMPCKPQAPIQGHPHLNSDLEFKSDPCEQGPVSGRRGYTRRHIFDALSRRSAERIQFPHFRALSQRRRIQRPSLSCIILLKEDSRPCIVLRVELYERRHACPCVLSATRRERPGACVSLTRQWWRMAVQRPGFGVLLNLLPDTRAVRRRLWAATS